MSERIMVDEYLDAPIKELEFKNGTVWKLRQPHEDDFYATQKIAKKHRAKRQAKIRALAAEAEKATEAAGGDDDAGRQLIEEDASEYALQRELSSRYLSAAILSVFIEPPQTPEAILNLGPDIISYLHLLLDEVLTGDAAKKRLAAERAVES